MVDCLFKQISLEKKILTKTTLIERYHKREHSAVEILVQSFQAWRKLSGPAAQRAHLNKKTKN